jgi:hypothetical protein
VKMVAAAPLAPAMARPADGAAAYPGDSGPKEYLEPFDYTGVRLLEGRLRDQFIATRDYYFAIPDDDLLKGLRARAGLPAPGNDLIGWYAGNPARPRDIWARGDTFHTFGQFLSGMARLAKAGNDSALRNKAATLMTEWGKTIEPDGYFHFSRHPWTPHYIYEKTVCGLVDLYTYGGQKSAAPLLETITGWAVKNLDRTRPSPTPAARNASGTEWYTLPENLYHAYQATGNSLYKTFGDLWRYDTYWGMFSRDVTPTPAGLHAYSHVNTFSSAAMAYAMTGAPQYLRTIVNAFDFFQHTQCYATGGFGPDENLVAADGSLGRSIEATSASFETPCGTWAVFKLCRYLLQFTGEARFGDWIEKLVYNGIGAALPMGEHGKTFYYADYRLGGSEKLYLPYAAWPCCSGTYPQAVAEYHNLIYFRNPRGLFVNLFVPSQVTWNHQGREIVVEQETNYPESGVVSLTIRSAVPVPFDLSFRVPGWSSGVHVEVNGETYVIPARPGNWAIIRREWKPGDRVAIQIPMRLGFSRVDEQHPNRAAVTYGPVVMVRDDRPTLTPAESNLGEWMPALSGGLEFHRPRAKESTIVPFYRVGYGTPYNMYFDLEA